jgi:hypothetical protein
MPNELRILSGTVYLPRGGMSVGSFIISFYPLSLDAAPPGAELRNAKEIGAQGPFIGAPATFVTARQFTITEGDLPYEFVNINDTVTRQSLSVDWARRHDRDQVFVEEVPFMAIGMVLVKRGGQARGGMMARKRARGRSGPRQAGKKGRR